MKKTILISAIIFSFSGSAIAKDLNSISSLAQAEFKSLSEDLTAGLSYKAVAPAEPLGVTGFDVGFEVTAVKISDTSAFDIASGSNFPSTLPIPKAHIHKGLPMNIDVGAYYSSVPTTNITLYGGEIRYAFMEGSTVTPAVAMRGTFSKMGGVDELDLTMYGIELSVSKGFANITPYATIGNIWGTSTPKGIALLKEEDISSSKWALGANINFGLFNMDLEHDSTGGTQSTSIKFGLRF